MTIADSANTHYWTPAKFNEKQWEVVCADAAGVWAHPRLRTHVNGKRHLGLEGPVVSPEVLEFFGNPGFDAFTYSNGGGWACCSTSGRPYEIAVKATLLVIMYHAKNFDVGGQLTSDHSWEDWKEARDLVEEILDIQFKESIL